MADVRLHSEFEIAPKQLTGRFRKFGTIAATCLSYLYNLFIYARYKLLVTRFAHNTCVIVV